MVASKALRKIALACLLIAMYSVSSLLPSMSYVKWEGSPPGLERSGSGVLYMSRIIPEKVSGSRGVRDTAKA